MKNSEDLTGDEYQTIVDHYLKKLDTDERMNVFLKYFRLPKKPLLFLFVTSVILSGVELLTNSWIPSIVAVFTMWHCLIALCAKFEIAEKSMIEECVMTDSFINDWESFRAEFPEDPLYVTENDRNFIMRCQIQGYKNMSWHWKWRRHHLELIFAMLFYIIIYMALKFQFFY